MAVQVDTSPRFAATIQYQGRKILRTSNGTLWVIAIQAAASIPRLRYSTDDGANWSTSSTAFAETVDDPYAAWVFCSDGAIYMLYAIADGSAIKVRKGTLNGAHTDISWSAATTVNTASGQEYFDLAAHEEGGDTIVHVVYATNGTLCEYKRAVWGSAFGSATALTTWSGVTTPRIEFNHTQADVTAVKDSAPHIYVAWYEDGKVMFQKFVFSSGPTWTPNTARTITSDAKVASGFQSLAMSFDGTDCVMIVESEGTADALLVLERDAADTTTTSLANTPARTGTGTSYCAITYSPERDIEVFHSDATAAVMERVTYDRSGSSWGSWATIDADADDRYPNVKIGYWSGSKADAVEVLFMDSTGPPYLLMHERFTFAAPITPTDLTVTATAGTVTVTTPIPIIPAALTVTVTAGTVGVAAKVLPGPLIVTATAGAMTVTTSTPIVPAAVTVTATPGTATVTTETPITPSDTTVNATAGTMTVTTGSVSIVPTALTVNATPGTFTVKTVIPIAPTALTVTVTAGGLTITVGAATVTLDTATVNATAGTVTVAIPAVISKGFVSITDSGDQAAIADTVAGASITDSGNRVVSTDR